MAFLNPPDVLPEAMRFLTRALLAAGGSLDEEALVRLVAPEGLVEALDEAAPEVTDAPLSFKQGGRVIATASLAAMRGAGLVVKGDGGAQRLAPPVTERFPKWELVTQVEFARLLRETALTTVRAEWEDELPAGAEDLANALALLLSMPDPLDPVRAFETGAGKTLSGYQSDHFGPTQSTWIVRNKERYLPLVRWTTYLGMGRVLGDALVIDPAAALEAMALPLLDRESPITKFLDQLGAIMPYTDRGVVGTAVRRRVGASSSEVSPGLALGLIALHHQERIVLTGKSDAESVGFRVDPELAVSFSHIAPAGAS